jgi:hypothetical protein
MVDLVKIPKPSVWILDVVARIARIDWRRIQGDLTVDLTGQRLPTHLHELYGRDGGGITSLRLMARRMLRMY